MPRPAKQGTITFATDLSDIMLFQYQKFTDAGHSALDHIEPPLCPVRFSAGFSDWRTVDEQPSYVHVLPSGATVTGWQREDCHLELLLCDLEAKLPNGRQVEGCRAAMWRVRALDRLQPLAFSTTLVGVPEDAEIGPESGEGLDAQSWTANGNLLMLSTEDGDYLSNRARERDWMPFRLQERLASRFPQYLTDGLTVNMPALDSAELCQVQFVLAWSPSDQPSHSASVAVDRNPAEILAAAGCS